MLCADAYSTSGTNLQPDVDAMLLQLRSEWFYDKRHRNFFLELAVMREHGRYVDTVTVKLWLGGKKDGDQNCGGFAYWNSHEEQAATVNQFTEFKRVMQELHLRRECLVIASEIKQQAELQTVMPELLQSRLSALAERAKPEGNQPMLDLIGPEVARAYEPDPQDFLIGDGLINRSNVVTIAGEPGIGKSRLAVTAAVAGARGTNSWLKYPVRNRWRTCILQTENDGSRLKEEFTSIPPEYDDAIRISRGLSHGMAFDNTEFRRELRCFFDSWPFQMLVIDPWNDVSFEDAQKDFKQSLLNISSVFRGTRMPCILIVAHLRKRGRDEANRRKSGRELLHELSGSLALGSSSRTVIVGQPGSPSMDDDRVVVELAKANNCHPDWLKEHGVRSAWHRRNGAFVACDLFDWQAWDNPGSETERRAVTEEMVRSAFDGEAELKPAHLAKILKSRFKVGESTVFRAIGEDGYLRSLMMRNGNGKLKLKEG
jgi:hypothetical protein